jgi:membrane-bound inhibitor of C-type lysozyme
MTTMMNHKLHQAQVQISSSMMKKSNKDEVEYQCKMLNLGLKYYKT